MKININELRAFLIKAKKSTYAAGESARKVIQEDKSTTMVFEEENWKYHDNYFGGEPYGGREVVFFHGEPAYMMVYYGWVDENVADVKLVYGILQSALTCVSEDKPFRGPKKYVQDELIYVNHFEGEIENFFGHEMILNENGEKMYEARYIGGLVDQRR